MIKNFQEIVSQIKSQAPIQELISEFIPIKKSGRGYVALCPFHDDHHPSLQIHPQKGIFKCFACGTGGDLITFYALINKKKWSEVIPELASKYNLKVEYGHESKTEAQIKTQLYDLNRDALNYFKNNLLQHDGKDTFKYLISNRQLSNDTVEKYEIGYALNSWDALFNYLSKEKKYTHELIIASGLFIPRENQQGYYDRFRNRIIFPIFNENNKVIGFGGRTLNNDEVKYINSPETIIFNKGQNLYGLNFAKEEIKKLDYTILTEGYFDVISAQTKGLPNTVATLGTALTVNQARLLTKYTNSKLIYLCLDTDIAGKKAIENIFRLSQEINRYVSLDLRVATNLPKKDLDESLISYSPTEIKETILNSQKLTDFIFDKIANDYNKASSDIDKKMILDELIEIIISIRDPIEQKENSKYIAHKLNIEEELINIKIKNTQKAHKQKALRFKEIKTENEDEAFKMHSFERFKHAELELLALYISSFPHKVDEVKADLNNFEFLDDKHKLIKEFIDNMNNVDIRPQTVIDNLILEYNEYKHLMSIISDLAWRIDIDQSETENNYLKNKSKLISEAKESINWWITNKQKMKLLTDTLKDCKNTDEEKKILSQMINLIKDNSSKVRG